MPLLIKSEVTSLEKPQASAARSPATIESGFIVMIQTGVGG